MKQMSNHLKNLIKTPKKSVIARSEKQSEYIKFLKENDIIIALGPAGTGKKFFSCISSGDLTYGKEN